MGPKDVLLNTIGTSDFILKSYMDGLSDSDIKLRPIEGMNSIALQLGHIIVAERMFAEMLRPGVSPALPDGFAEAHSLKEPRGDDSHLLTKDGYMSLLEAQRQATLKILGEIPESELESNQDGKLPPWAPTVAAVLNMVGLHSLNHSSQFVATRRMLKMKVAF